MDGSTLSPEQIQLILEENKRLKELLRQNRNLAQDTSSSHSTQQSKEETKIHKLPSGKFHKRPGTSDSGKDYEQLMCALCALKLIKDSNVEDFEMTSNNNQHGDFDDIGIKVWFKDKTVKTFLFQLKHKEKHKQLKNAVFESQKGDFSAQKYFDSISKISLDGETIFILFTNVSTYIQSKTQLTDGTVVEICDQVEHEDLLMNTKKQNCVLKFLREDKEFYMFTNQSNVIQVEATIKEYLQEMIHYDIYTSLMHFMKQWWSDSYILTKEDFISKLVELALSPLTSPLTGEKRNEKTDYLKEAMMLFQTTLVRQSEDIVQNIWDLQSFPEDDSNMKKRLKLATLDQVLWHLGQIPCVVKVNALNRTTIKCVLKLLRKCVNKKTVILLGEVTKEDFEEVDIFENLQHLLNKSENQNIYKNIVNNFKVSIQGRKSVPLEQLLSIDKDIAKIVTTSELFEMSQTEDLIIGKKQDEIPELHIPRTVTVNLLRTQEVINYFEKTNDVAIFNCGKDYKDTLKLDTFNSSGILEITDHLKDDNTDYRKYTILLFTNYRCTIDEFNQICGKFEKNNVYLLQKFDEENPLLLKQKGESLPLRSTMKSIEEENIFGLLKDSLNVLCAPPGMGKTRLMKIITRSCSFDYWIVHINLINQNSFLSRKPKNEDIEAWLLELESKNKTSFFKKLQDIYHKNKKVIFVLDGLDEVNTRYVDDVMKFVKELSSRNINVWISSRENLRETISCTLNPILIQLNELDKEQQKKYIYRKLEKQYEPEKITKIINAVFNSFDLNNSQMLLGIPLQLHIITEMFLYDNQVYENLQQKNIFVLTQMYRSFFEGKLKSSLEKVIADESLHQLRNQKFLLKQYQVPALMVCLDEEDLSKLDLKLDESNDFIEDVKINGDKYGIIKAVSEGFVPIFDHQTFAEYFTCVWLSENKEKAVLLRDKIFVKRYENMRLMLDVMMAENNPLHLAVIYKSGELINRHVEDVNQEDKGGRTVLHLACSYGERYNFYSDKCEPKWYIYLMETIVKDNVNVKKTDKLFVLNCIEYSLNSGCLYPIEIFLKKQLIIFDEVKESIAKFNNFKKIAFYAARLGYSHLLSEVIYGELSKYNEKEISDLLMTAIRGFSQEENSKIRQGNQAAVQVLLNNNININKTNEKGFTALDVVCIEGYYNVIQIIREKGGLCTEGNTILHRLVEGRCTKEQLQIFTKCGININTRNNYGQTPLHVACKKGYINIVEALLEEGADPNVLDSDDNNLLILELQSSNPNKALMLLLIDSGLDIKARNKSGMAALDVACTTKNIQVVRRLLQKGADINVLDEDGDNLLTSELRSKNPNNALMLLLIDSGVDIKTRNKYGMTALHLAYTRGNIKIIKKLLEMGADTDILDSKDNNLLMCELQALRLNIEIIFLLIDTNIDINPRNRSGTTALHLACKLGNVIITKKLYEKGADASIVDNEGNNCLMYFAQFWKANVEIMDFLISSSLDVNAQNSSGMTALLLACKNGNNEIAKMLLAKGADANIVDKENNNCLMYVVEHWEVDIEMINLLINLGLDINARNKFEKTAVHLACNQETIELLFEKGADLNTLDSECNNLLMLELQSSQPRHEVVDFLIDSTSLDINTKNIYGLTALYLACSSGNVEITRKLLERGANFNVTGIEGDNCLMYAAQSSNSNTEIIDFLIDFGFDVNARNKSGTTALHFACYKGNFEIIKTLLEKGADANVVDNEGNNFLMCELQRWHPNTEIVLLLIELNFDINARNMNGTTALHFACNIGSINIVKKLLDKGAKSNIVDSNGYNCLMYAAKSRKSNVEVINFLLDLGFDINVKSKSGITALHLACKYGNIEVVKILLEKGADVNVSNNGDNLLMSELQSNKPNNAIMLLLIDSNIDVKTRNVFGTTALQLACEKGNVEIVKKILDKKTDIDVVDNDGNNLLMCQLQSCHMNKAIVFLLIDSGLDINARNNSGITAFHLACNRGNIDIIKTLLDNGVDANIVDNNGNNCLMYAAQSWKPNLEIINFLIDLGFDVKTRNNSGMVALHFACNEGNFEIVKKLVESGANAGVVDNDGNNCLMYAAEARKTGIEIINLWIELGLDINATNKFGITAFDIACKYGNVEVAKYLLDKGANANVQILSQGD